MRTKTAPRQFPKQPERMHPMSHSDHPVHDPKSRSAGIYGKATVIGGLAFVCLVFFFLNHQSHTYTIVAVPGAMLAPFVLLILSIAIVPFVSARWWERNYPVFSITLGAIAVVYYFFILKNGPRMVHAALEYFSFIALIGSLFIISGGIHIRIKGRSTPKANIVLLAIGAALANLFGTTGASMILIRPYLRVNKYRISGYHVVFFIFIVSNMGGLLTPIGDPPLFLGFLKGVPFFWVISRTWAIWLIVNMAALAIFYAIDLHNFRKIPLPLEHTIEEEGEQARIQGLHNIIFLMITLGAVFLERPAREITMFCAAAASYLATREKVHEQNGFNFLPIKEVAILFAGIFTAMVPVLDWLESSAGRLGITAPGQFYWGAGLLSSVLDNAPTYLSFLSAACGLHGLSVDNLHHMKALLGLLPHEQLSRLTGILGAQKCLLGADSWKYIQAISTGSVIFGAMTYIGNGPNFMVKSIAEQAHVRMPGFFEYIVKYSIPILLPIFALIWFFFFREF
jgi:Na+/H+ antiporter NhaD/arsenite permease-like protein